MSWNWDHLRYFLALADAETLVAAARDLDVSHTTVLRRVKAFEAELETQLFEHTQQGYRLNTEGESLYAEAIKMKHVLDKVSRQIGGADKQALGEVVITTTDTLADRVLPALLSELAHDHPGLRFSLNMMNRMSDIDNYEADIAIRSCRQPPEKLIGRRVGTVNFVVCASGSYVRQHGLDRFPVDVDMHRFIVMDSSYKESVFRQWLDERLSPETYRTTASNFLCAAALCRQDMGITVLPDYMLAEQDVLVALPTDEPIPGNELWILSHPDSRDKERVRIVRRYLYDRLLERFGTA